MNRDMPTDDKNPESKTRKLDLSATQLVGGALAAMTSAVIGAQLGVAGTVLGAAVGSVVAGTAGTLYTTSLRHTKTKISSVVEGKVGKTQVELTQVPEEAVRLDRPAWDPVPQAAEAPPSLDPVAAAADLDSSGKPASRVPWKAILVSTAAVFLIAIAAITGFELVSGQAISGGEGTTITQVRDTGPAGTDRPTQAPTGDPSAEPSTQPSEESSAEPSVDPSQSSEPDQGAEPSDDPGQSDPSAEQPPPVGDEPPAGGTDGGEAGGGVVDGG